MDAKLNGRLGIPLIAFAPFASIAIDIYFFGKVSMTHFNPAVTLGFLNIRHITKKQLLLYIPAEITGAPLASLFVKHVIGNEAFLGANSPNYAYPLPLIFGVEILASALLMAVILVVVFTKGLRGFSGLVIGGIVGLDIFFFRVCVRRINEPATFVGPCLVV